MSVPYDAAIYINEEHFTTIHNVGSMTNAKRHAKKIADSLQLTPIDKKWDTHKTYYDPNTGLHGSWESKAYRRYRDRDQNEINIKIYRN